MWDAARGFDLIEETMDNRTLIGLAAGTLTTISFMPQVIKAWKSKSTKDISIGMYSALSVGLSLWIFYGFAINSTPVIFTNVISLILALVVLLLKIKHG
jgi:MtN3 and saliva related transmembrane protein